MVVVATVTYVREDEWSSFESSAPSFADITKALESFPALTNQSLLRKQSARTLPLCSFLSERGHFGCRNFPQLISSGRSQASINAPAVITSVPPSGEIASAWHAGLRRGSGIYSVTHSPLFAFQMQTFPSSPALTSHRPQRVPMRSQIRALWACQRRPGIGVRASSSRMQITP